MLEFTKKDIKKFGKQRKQLDEYYLKDKNANLVEWERYLSSFEHDVNEEKTK